MLLRAHSRKFIEEVKITCTKEELEKLSNDELDRIAADKSLAAAPFGQAARMLDKLRIKTGSKRKGVVRLPFFFLTPLSC